MRLDSPAGVNKFSSINTSISVFLYFQGEQLNLGKPLDTSFCGTLVLKY